VWKARIIGLKSIKMAKHGLKWGLLCAILLCTLATTSVFAGEDDGVPEEVTEEQPKGDNEYDLDEACTDYAKETLKLLKDDAIEAAADKCETACTDLKDEGVVNTLEECTKNLMDGKNPDGTPQGVNCGDGLIIPIWRPYTKLTGGDRFGRGLLYILFMVYLFIGVSIVSDRFMESIEMITAQEKEVTVKDPKSGKNQVIIVKVWNETVANLSLMALGSSAPEILLSVVEIWAKGFEAGDLGPGTIVGSAAFNLFMIIGLCIYVIPDDEVRKIKPLLYQS
jgi:hypothetical protein